MKLLALSIDGQISVLSTWLSYFHLLFLQMFTQNLTSVGTAGISACMRVCACVRELEQDREREREREREQN